MTDRLALVRECGRGGVPGRGNLGSCTLCLEVGKPEVGQEPQETVGLAHRTQGQQEKGLGTVCQVICLDMI